MLRPSRYSTIPIVAVLGMAALVAVLMYLGGTPASAESTPTFSGSAAHANPQQQAGPEACADTPDPVVDSGRIAMFDVYWDAEGQNLVSNPCPPTIEYIPEGENDAGDEVPAHESRAASDVDIGSTIIHVPSTYKETLSADSATDRAKYGFMYDESGDLISDQIWVLPTCDPSYGSTAGASDLCVAFSASLLRASDWKSSGTAPEDDEGDVQFEFEYEEELGIKPADEGEAFVFYPHDDIPTGDEDDQVTWRTDNADQNELLVAPGTYEYRQWGFTKPGTYVFSVHAKGHPTDALSDKETITSEVVHYTFHVGLLAELNTNISADVATPDIGDTVTITVTANNEGPAQGDDVWVKVPLPDGLTFVSATTASGSYDSNTGIWSVGTMVAPPNAANPTRATLTLTATVDAGTRGESMEVSAIIGGIETIGASKVTELDPHNEHHASTVTITPLAHANVAPMFSLTRSVDENSAAGTTVGDPVTVFEPDTSDALTYTITGDGAVNFTAVATSGGAQVQVSSIGYLNYEITQFYDLVLNVSDGLDENGNSDSSVDHSIALRVNVNDVYEPPPAPIRPITVTMTADSSTNPIVGGNGFRFTLDMEYDESYSEDNLMFDWVEHDQDGSNERTSSGSVNLQETQPFYPIVTPDAPVTRQYQITLWVDDDPEAPGIRTTVGQSDVVTVEWRRASN